MPAAQPTTTRRPCRSCGAKRWTDWSGECHSCIYKRLGERTARRERSPAQFGSLVAVDLGGGMLLIGEVVDSRVPGCVGVLTASGDRYAIPREQCGIPTGDDRAAWLHKDGVLRARRAS